MRLIRDIFYEIKYSFAKIRIPVLVVVIAFLFMYNDNLVQDESLLSWLLFISCNISLLSAILVAVMSASGDTICDDMENNYYRQVILRKGLFRYVISKNVATYVISFVCMFTGFMFSVVIRGCMKGFPSAQSVMDTKSCGYEMLYTDVLYKYNWVIFAICIGLHLSVLAATVSLLALLFSLYVNNRLLAYVMPVACINIWDMICQRFMSIEGRRYSVYCMGITELTFTGKEITVGWYYMYSLIIDIIIGILIYRRIDKKVRWYG